MTIKTKKLLLYILLSPAVIIIVWFFIQKSIGDSKNKKTKFLYEVGYQNEYTVKRVSTDDRGYPYSFPGEDSSPDSPVYLDPGGNSVWVYFTEQYRKEDDRPDDSYRTRDFWVQYNFEGTVLQKLEENTFPPTDGKFLPNKMWGFDYDINSSKSRMHATYFQYQSINWIELNPFRYGSPNGGMRSNGPWDGIVQMRLAMPDGPIDFKIATSKTNDGYGFSGQFFEVPSELADNQLIIFYLEYTSNEDDKGLYFIYK